jgi:hypothetical protein
VDTGTAIPLEKGDTPFKGTVKLYAQKDCQTSVLGLPDAKLEVTQDICNDEKLLGLIPAGFRSYNFEFPKATTTRTFIAGAYSKQGCAKPDLLSSSIKSFSLKKGGTGCVNVAKDGNTLARSFTFARIS